MQSSLSDSPTFEQALALTQSFLEQVANNILTEQDIESNIASLVKTVDGARGFFVTYLTGDSPLADNPSNGVILALKSSPNIVSDLLVKNLAMSTAMALTHLRNNQEEMAQGSDQVKRRSLNLIQRLQLPEIAEKLQELNLSLVSQEGEYQAFLKRWGYDSEQRQAIQNAIFSVGNG